MKKLFPVIGMLVWMLTLAVETAHAQARIGDAVQNAAESLSPNIGTGARIAVLSIGAASQRMSDFLVNGMIDAFVGKSAGRYTVVSRNQVELDLVRWELDFQMSWEVDETTAQSIGRILGVQYIATGAFEPRMNYYHFRVRIIHVETAAIRNVHNANVRRDRFVRDLLGTGGGMAALFNDPARFWSVGVSAGTSFAEPLMIGTLQVTLAPLRNSFLRLGFDLGFLSGVEGVGYFSAHPFAHYAFFLPFYALPLPLAGGGWHIGVGGGFMMAEYRFDDFDIPIRTFMADFITGFNIGNAFDVSYTLRTDFSAVTHKISAGFTHRF